MKFASKSAAVLAFVLALAACGGGADEAEEPAAADTPAATDTAAPAVDATPTDAASPTPSDTPSATPTPTPTASASVAPTPRSTGAAVTEPAAFAVCKACHAVEPGKHGIGPSLAGIWGEKAGDVPGFEFSQQMKDSGLVWNQASLDRYLTDPRGTVPGTKMAFGGVKDATKRQEIIDYIRGL